MSISHTLAVASADRVPTAPLGLVQENISRRNPVRACLPTRKAALSPLSANSGSYLARCMVVVLAAFACTVSHSSVSANPESSFPQATILPKLPVEFEANQGQHDPAVRYLARAAGYQMFLTREGTVIALTGAKAGSDARSSAVTMQFNHGKPVRDILAQGLSEVLCFSSSRFSKKSARLERFTALVDGIGHAQQLARQDH